MEIDYFFEFQDQAAALADAVVGPYLLDPFRSRSNIWGFDLTPNLAISPPPPQPPLTRETFFWCMVAQSMSVAALATHPKLQFILTLPGPLLTLGTGFVLPAPRALYAQNWAFSSPPSFNLPIETVALISVSGAALTDVNGDVLVTFR